MPCASPSGCERAFDVVLADPPYTIDYAARLRALFRRRPFARILSVEHRSDLDARRRRHPALRRYRHHLLSRAMTRIAVYPGSFDPPTPGPRRSGSAQPGAGRPADRRRGGQPEKQPLFSVEERLDMLRAAVGNDKRVSFQSFDGLAGGVRQAGRRHHHRPRAAGGERLRIRDSRWR